MLFALENATVLLVTSLEAMNDELFWLDLLPTCDLFGKVFQINSPFQSRASETDKPTGDVSNGNATFSLALSSSVHAVKI